MDVENVNEEIRIENKKENENINNPNDIFKNNKFNAASILARKRVRPLKTKQKQKSQEEQIVDVIIANGMRDKESISKYFINQIPTMDSNLANFYLQLAKSVVYNARVGIADILNGRYFYYYYGSTNYTLKSNVFTNDRLYWITLLYNSIKENETLQKIIEIDDGYVNLQTLCEVQKGEYKKGYIQDYYTDFSIIGFDSLSLEDQTKLLNGDLGLENALTGEYTIKGITYTYYIYQNGAILTFDKKLADNVKDIMKNVKVVDSKKNMKDGLKVYKIEETRSVFLSQKLKLVDFFSGELDVTNPLSFSYLFKININMNEFEKYFIKQVDANINKNDILLGDIIEFQNFIYWDTFDLFVDFLIVEKMTTLKEKKYNIIKSKIDSFIETWKTIKSDFKNIKSAVEPILAFFVKFYSSFPTKISFSTMVKLSKYLSKIKPKFETVAKSNISGKIINFLTKFGLKKNCLTIYNCCNREFVVIKAVLNKVQDFLQGMLNKDLSDPITLAKEIGRNIFSLFMNNINDIYLINTIKSPALFMGDLQNGNDQIIEDAINKMDNILNNEIENDIQENEELKFIKETPYSTGLKYLIKIYFETRNVDDELFSETDDNDIAFKGVLNKWFESQGIQNQFEKSPSYDKVGMTGLKSMYNEQSWDSITTMPKIVVDYMENLYNDYVTYVKTNNLVEQQEIIDKENQINKDKIELEDMKKGSLVYINENQNASKRLQQKLGIRVFTQGEINAYGGEEELIKLRKKGITDDVIRKRLDGIYDGDFKYLAENPEEINNLINETQKLWGKEGSQSLLNQMNIQKTKPKKKKKLKRVKKLFKTVRVEDEKKEDKKEESKEKINENQ